MRFIVLILVYLTFLPLSAQNAVPSVIRDRDVLPKELWTAYDKAKEYRNKAFTTLEMRDAAGPMEAAAESLFVAAAMYRLKRLLPKEQIVLLKELYQLGRVTDRIDTAPWEGTGTQEPIYRSRCIHDLLFHHIKIWTLSDSQYAQWRKIGFAKFEFDNVEYNLKNGLSCFLRKEKDGDRWWTITILPELFLEYKGNLYTLVAIDHAHAPTANSRISYFCKLGGDGILHQIHRYEEVKLTTMKVTDKKIVFYEWGEYSVAAIPLSGL